MKSNLSEITGIRPSDLENYRHACVAAKLSWGARLRAFSGENRSYAMLEILGISMDLRYGEGEKEAFRRLQESIIEQVKDESLFVWTDPTVSRSGLIAPSIDSFAGCRDIALPPSSLPRQRRFRARDAPDGDKRGVSVETSKSIARYTSPTTMDLVLKCSSLTNDSHRDEDAKLLQITLHNDLNDSWRRYPRGGPEDLRSVKASFLDQLIPRSNQSRYAAIMVPSEIEADDHHLEQGLNLVVLGQVMQTTRRSNDHEHAVEHDTQDNEYTDSESDDEDAIDPEYTNANTDGLDDAAFWIPQATPDGRLFYFNTLTGESTLEVPTGG